MAAKLKPSGKDQANEKAKTSLDRRYGGHGVPRKLIEGRVIAHNHVMHDPETWCGFNGFRWWRWPTEDVPETFVSCPCGYGGVPHVAHRDFVKHERKRQKLRAELGTAMTERNKSGDKVVRA